MPLTPEERHLVVRRVARLGLTRYLAVVVHPEPRPAPAAAQLLAELTGAAHVPVS